MIVGAPDAAPGRSSASTTCSRASPNEATTAAASSPAASSRCSRSRRALLTNPRLLIMDEPTEGLAPVIVSQVEEMLIRLGEEGDIAILVIEQNIGVATSVSDNVAIMVNGRINRIIESRRLAADRELQQRLLGRRPPFRCGEPDARGAARRAAPPPPARRRQADAAPVRIYVSNPIAADPLVAAGPDRADRSRRAHASVGVARIEDAPRAGSLVRRRRRGRRPCSSSARSTPRVRSCASCAISSSRAASGPGWSTSRPAASRRPAT